MKFYDRYLSLSAYFAELRVALFNQSPFHGDPGQKQGEIVSMKRRFRRQENRSGPSRLYRPRFSKLLSRFLSVTILDVSTNWFHC